MSDTSQGWGSGYPGAGVTPPYPGEAPTYQPGASSPVYAPSELSTGEIPAGRGDDSGDTSTAEVAKDQAASVAGGAADAAQQVAGVAKEQAGQVAAEAGRQARQLLGQAQSELSDQAGVQQQRAAAGLHSVGDQLQSMAGKSDQSGLATDLAQRAGDRAHEIAGWLEDRDPGSVLNEVRSFARQRPGVFLALALGAGLVAGRLARGLAADPDSMDADSTPSPSSSYRAPAPSALGTTGPASAAGQLPASTDVFSTPGAAAPGLTTGFGGEQYPTGRVPDQFGEPAGGWGENR